MARIRRLVVVAATLAVAGAAFNSLRGRGNTSSRAVPPPPPTRPPQRPSLDEAPRPASEPDRPKVKDDSPGTGSNPSGNPIGSEASGAVSKTDLLEMSKDQLYAEARRRNLAGRSRMTKEQLAQALSKG